MKYLFMLCSTCYVMSDWLMIFVVLSKRVTEDICVSGDVQLQIKKIVIVVIKPKMQKTRLSLPPKSKS